MGYCAVALHKCSVYSFVGFSLVQFVLLSCDAFVGAEACHCQASSSCSCRSISGQPQAEPKKSQQTNKTINQTNAWQQYNNLYNLEQSGICPKEKQNSIRAEHQIPSSQQLTHLIMVCWAETCSGIQ